MKFIDSYWLVYVSKIWYHKTLQCWYWRKQYLIAINNSYLVCRQTIWYYRHYCKKCDLISLYLQLFIFVRFICLILTICCCETHFGTVLLFFHQFIYSYFFIMLNNHIIIIHGVTFRMYILATKVKTTSIFLFVFIDKLWNYEGLLGIIDIHRCIEFAWCL